MIVDTFMFNAEFDMLTCRLDTMAPVVDYFVAVEADVDHQGHPKPYHLSDNLDRFAEWADKLIVVRATGLPVPADDVMLPLDLRAWSREWAQRDWVWQGLDQVPGLDDDTIVLHGDVDEICSPLHVRNVRPGYRQFILFGQSLYSFAVDWLHPDVWGGTVATTVASARELGERVMVDDMLAHPGAWQVIRNQRNGIVTAYLSDGGRGWSTIKMLNSGWHFSWIGGQQAAVDKLGAFCHPEIADRVATGLEADTYMSEGWHVDGRKLSPVDVDGTWPKWIQDGHAPASWFRPRDVPAPAFHERWFMETSQRVLADLVAEVADVPGLIIEIGSWEGRSTVALAKAAYPRQVHAVDTWAGSSTDLSGDLAAERDVHAQWRVNVDAYTAGNVVEHRMGWRDYVADLAEPVAMVFIDAEHTYDEVRDNIDALLPWMSPGGVMCGDDVHDPGVIQAAFETFPDGLMAATLWIGRTP